VYLTMTNRNSAMPYAKAARDQFEILQNKITHKPTGAEFTSRPGQDKEIAYVNWDRCGSALPNGDDYSRDDVHKIAKVLMAEQEIT
jgi:hypothetical protein